MTDDGFTMFGGPPTPIPDGADAAPGAPLLPEDETGNTPRGLGAFLDRLEDEAVSPSQAGGVPLPKAWACLRATIGGASRRDLEDAERPTSGPGQRNDARTLARKALDDAEQFGTHLPAGLHIVTGQTGGGKSAFVMNLAHGVLTADQPHPVLYVSLELDGLELAARLVALESVEDVAPGVPTLPWYRLAQRRPLEEGARARRSTVVRRTRSYADRLDVIAPEGRLSLPHMRAAALALWRKHGRVPLVVFDYLQAAGIANEATARLPLREQIAAVTMELRRVSRELPREAMAGAPGAPTWPGCPVVVLSITARANVRGTESVPGMDGVDPDRLRLADLETLKALPKEAGEIEATAVTAWVMALGEKTDAGTHPLCLRLAKYRGGPKGQWIPFTFEVQTGRLEEAPTRYAAAHEEGLAAAQAKDAKRGSSAAPTSSSSALDMLERTENGPRRRS